MMRFCQATIPGQRKLSPPSNPIFLDFTPPTPATTNLAITTTQSSNSQIPKCAESSTPCGNPYLPSLPFLPSLYIVNTQTNPPKKKTSNSVSPGPSMPYTTCRVRRCRAYPRRRPSSSKSGRRRRRCGSTTGST